MIEATHVLVFPPNKYRSSAMCKILAFHKKFSLCEYLQSESTSVCLIIAWPEQCYTPLGQFIIKRMESYTPQGRVYSVKWSDFMWKSTKSLSH
jgi:hypothetical protein